MSDVISTETIIRQLESRGAKFIIVGALVDLTMQNGWVKNDEFVAIDAGDAEDAIERLECNGQGVFGFVSKLIDANNNVRRITINCHVENWPGGYSRNDVKIPNIVSIAACVEGDNITCSNVRLITHLSIGWQVIGQDYANGDLWRRNVDHSITSDTSR